MDAGCWELDVWLMPGAGSAGSWALAVPGAGSAGSGVLGAGVPGAGSAGSWVPLLVRSHISTTLIALLHKACYGCDHCGPPGPHGLNPCGPMAHTAPHGWDTCGPLWLETSCRKKTHSLVSTRWHHLFEALRAFRAFTRHIQTAPCFPSTHPNSKHTKINACLLLIVFACLPACCSCACLCVGWW